MHQIILSGDFPRWFGIIVLLSSFMTLPECQQLQPVPDVVGMRLGPAREDIENAGFELGTVTQVFTTDAPSGEIIGQTPPADTMAELGSRVDLTIATNVLRFVNKASPAAQEDQDGLSWETAWDELQEALDILALEHSGEIWVAAGTYDEVRWDAATQDGNPNGALVMKEDISLIGGFNGTETHRFQRDWTVNSCVIDGSNGRGTGLPAFHVVQGANDAILDGFTITGGAAIGVNAQQQNGGGMFNNGVGVIVGNCTFIGNTAQGDGGAMYNVNSTSTVLSTVFTQNTAKNGGAVYELDSSTLFQNCTFESNSANRDGGALYIENSSTQVVFGGITGNSAGTNRYGGGVLNDNATATFTNCVLSFNQALHGAAMCSQNNASPELNDCIILSNQARSEDENVIGTGGGMANYDSNPTIDSTIIVWNISERGGGIYNDASSPVLTESAVLDNLAVSNYNGNGGGIYNINDSAPTFFRCRIINNQSDWTGGGIENATASPVLVDCVLANNGAFDSGGGMLSNAGSAKISGTLVANNVATNGGAFYDDASSSVITNSLFLGNRASDTGGAVRSDFSTAVYTNCTFTQNAAFSAGCIYSEDSNIKVTNGILWGNMSQDLLGAIIDNDLTDDFLPVVNYSDITNGFVGTGNIDLDPMFVGLVESGVGGNLEYEVTLGQSFLTHNGRFEADTLAGLILWVDMSGDGSVDTPFFIVSNDANTITVWGDADDGTAAYEVRDYRLQSNSPCVDVGTNTSGSSFGGVVDDYFGISRPQGPAYDMGAFEVEQVVAAAR